MQAKEAIYDVAIIGGGPGGSTTASLLKRYAPELSILILEKERFPREHVGESQLPPISAVLDEMGAWDAVERARFPIKIGATYTWGKTTEPWVFEFLPVEQVPEKVERPGRFEGWRHQTAFQVDRALYDEILLRHAAGQGCEVREGTRVAEVLRAGDRVEGLRLEDGTTVRARWYVDASGAAALLRKALDVKVEVPTLLKNVAFWDYWENPAWANEPDVDVTRVHIRSVKYGWLWFIRLSPTRFSVGLVCNADFYKKSGKKPEQLYAEALASEKLVSARIVGATPRNQLERTIDWSFVVDRTYGENWFLVGEVAGFADPILAAGLTLTQTGARELAYTLLELERGEHDRAWLCERYDELQRRRVRQHMRFAEYWYSANGIFEDIRENCVEIAKDAGLSLTPVKAFQWLGQGGLGDDFPGQVGVGGLDVAGVKQVMSLFTGGDAKWSINGKNVFRLNLDRAKQITIGRLENGRIISAPCWVRGNQRLPLVGIQAVVVDILQRTSDAGKFMTELRERLEQTLTPEHVEVAVNHALQVLEVMVNEYWVSCDFKKNRPVLEIATPEEGTIIHYEKKPAQR